MEFIDNVTPSGVQQYANSALFDNSSLNKATKDQWWQMRNDYLTMYYQNAYNTALMNYQNAYNTPLQQMLRYQEAGISPWLVAGNMDAGNMSSSHAGAAPKGNFTAPNSVQRAAQGVQALGTLNQVIQSAGNMYQAMKYGIPETKQRIENLTTTGENLGIQQSILNEQLRKYAAEADWSQYWNYPAGEGGINMADSPRARYMEYSTQYKAAQVAQLESLVDNLYPSQVAANEARAALAAYQKEVLEGKNDAVLNLNTGYPQIDAWLKVVLMMMTNANLGVGLKF